MWRADVAFATTRSAFRLASLRVMLHDEQHAPRHPSRRWDEAKSRRQSRRGRSSRTARRIPRQRTSVTRYGPVNPRMPARRSAMAMCAPATKAVSGTATNVSKLSLRPLLPPEHSRKTRTVIVETGRATGSGVIGTFDFEVASSTRTAMASDTMPRKRTRVR